jgi:hypothetical protein
MCLTSLLWQICSAPDGSHPAPFWQAGGQALCTAPNPAPPVPPR